ncbi:MAG: hypothetical protein Q8K60_05965 [Parachlamydiaceae bacterium]|nr:hypothetical protein [Parachlamydiaceae bacterium]
MQNSVVTLNEPSNLYNINYLDHSKHLHIQKNKDFTFSDNSKALIIKKSIDRYRNYPFGCSFYSH